jgi:hypothetical protein
LIVLNSLKEIVRVESWTDITERPGFSGMLDPSKHSLDAIIGRYGFAEKVPCGLSNCQTPHNRGYIVATKDGQETNIGKDCGKTYFGVDFETLSNKFDRDLTEKENREKLWTFFFCSEEVAAQVASMRSEERGADWVFKQTKNLLDIRQVPGAVTRTLTAMIKSRDSRITHEREATGAEIAQLEQASGRRLPRPHYISVSLGELAGLPAFYPENNLRSILIEDLSVHLKDLNDINIDVLTYEQLRKWSQWIGALDATFERASAAVDSGRKLLTQHNLLPLAESARLNTIERDAFVKFLKVLARG